MVVFLLWHYKFILDSLINKVIIPLCVSIFVVIPALVKRVDSVVIPALVKRVYSVYTCVQFPRL